VKAAYHRIELIHSGDPLSLPDGIDDSGVGTAGYHRQPSARQDRRQGLIIGDDIRSVLAFFDRPESFHLLEALQARDLACGCKPLSQGNWTPAFQDDRPRRLGLASGKRQTDIFQRRTGFELGGEYVRMGQNRNHSFHLLQNCHQPSCVVIMAVAEADLIYGINVDIKKAGVMEQNLSAGPCIPEQFHAI